MDDELLIGIGDLHGYYSAFDTLLTSLDKRYEIFDGENKLKIGVKIVTTGDYIDRNSQALKIIDKLKRLQEINPDSVNSLIGNHEIMALKYLDIARELAKTGNTDDYIYTMHGGNGGMKFINEFDPKNKANAIKEYVKRFSRSGDIGSWIRSLSPYYIENFNKKNILFTHADIPLGLWNADKLKQYLEGYQEDVRKVPTGTYRAEEKYGELEGPLWERLFSVLSPADFNDMINSLKVDYIVTGHTPSQDNKIVNYVGRVFDIDVGMWQNESKDPVCILFKKDGIYEFNANKGEKRLESF